MALPFAQHFDACLPGIARPVRITSLYDAQVFARRWVIRDKDRDLRVLLRRLERGVQDRADDARAVSGRLSARARGGRRPPAM
jgi:hypothetical protein